MAISTLLTQTTWTDTNSLQPDSQTPLIVTAYSDSRPTQYVQTTMLLPAATSTPLALPVPASWTSVYAVQLTNIDTASNNGNYVQVAATSSASGSKAVLLIVSGNASNGNTVVFDTGDWTFTAVAGTPSAFQFQVAGSAALTLANLAAAINLKTATIGLSAVVMGTTSLLITGPITFSATSTSWGAFGTLITLPQATSTSFTDILAPLGGTFSSTSFVGASQLGVPLNLSLLTVQAVTNTGTYAGSSATQLYVYLAGA